jgi:lipopolysaccharide transport system ATP-binding protein
MDFSNDTGRFDFEEIVLRKKYHSDFWALKNVTLTVHDGETLGIIGMNGAGKSTLLKIITGIYIPDRGSVHLDGKITGLLELAVGFNFEMTGIENLYMYGILLGLRREEIEKRRDEIIDFSELGSFIYEPLKTYSSGMVMRLAFSIAICADPKCFVVDEALSVGDAHFQQKCMKRIDDFRKGGGSILFVSHDMNAVKILCDRALLIDHGLVIEDGSPEDVVNAYNFIIAKASEQPDSTIHQSAGKSSYGTFKAQITDVTIKGNNSQSNIVSSGEKTTVAVEIEAYEDIKDVTVGIVVRDKFGQDVFGTNTFHYNKNFDVFRKTRFVCTFIFDMNIQPGKYTVSAAIHSGETHMDNCMHWVDRVVDFEVAGMLGNYFVGICRLIPEITINQVRA